MADANGIMASANEAMVGEMKATRLSGERPAFENTFFSLILLHHEVVRGITRFETHTPLGAVFSGSPSTVIQSEGRRVLNDIAKELVSSLRNEKSLKSGLTTAELIEVCYDASFEFNRSFLSHYFRNFYHIVKYVDRHAPPEERHDYMDIVRAQLSTGEQVLLFYNCLTTRGDKFSDLIERYGLLEGMPFDQLADPNHKSLYAPSAYSMNAGFLPDVG